MVTVLLYFSVTLVTLVYISITIFYHVSLHLTESWLHVLFPDKNTCQPSSFFFLLFSLLGVPPYFNMHRTSRDRQVDSRGREVPRDKTTSAWVVGPTKRPKRFPKDNPFEKSNSRDSKKKRNDWVSNPRPLAPWEGLLTNNPTGPRRPFWY